VIQEAPILAPRKPHAIESFDKYDKRYNKLPDDTETRKLLKQMKLEIKPMHTNRRLAEWEIEEALPKKKTLW
jgi:hypothetical protein